MMQNLLKEEFHFFTLRKNFLLYKDSFKYLKIVYFYYLLDFSPWLVLALLSVFIITSVGVLYMHKFVEVWNLFLNKIFVNFYVTKI